MMTWSGQGLKRNATHQNVAQHFCAGLLWAMYPKWFDANIKEIERKRNGH